MHLNYRLIKDWPPLAWLAYCPVSSHEIDVFHGSQVEIKDTWVCEGIWDGPFEAGNFENTDLIFGSGARASKDHLLFVSPGSTVDRLQVIQVDGGVLVSNSLICILSMVQEKVDPTSTIYLKFFESIVRGLDVYEHNLETLAGHIKLIYFHNVKWDGSNLIEVEKPNPIRKLDSFHAYREFLDSSLAKLSDNLSSKERSFPFQMIGTLSSGYDSPTTVVLAKPYGLTDVISFKNARGGSADDGGRNAWQNRAMAEVPFISSDSKGEDVYFSSAEESLKGKVLITGFHGDKVWEKTNTKLDPYIVRGDQSGLSITEYRLWVGFIHMPMPFFGIRQIQDINALNFGEDMKPWDIGGNYNRPICRRIVEEAGVSRSEFGMSKKAASVLFRERTSFLTTESRENFLGWLRTNSKLWLRKNKLPPLWARFLLVLLRPLFKMATLLGLALKVLARVFPKGAARTMVRQTQKKVSDLDRREYLFKYSFPWASELAKERYGASSMLMEKYPEIKVSKTANRIHLLKRNKEL